MSHLYLGNSLEEIEHYSFANGSVCVYTNQSPDKDTGNEDSACLLTCNDVLTVLAVADGLGGLACGDKASQSAITELDKKVSSSCISDSSLREDIMDAFENANQAILAMGIGSATTLIAAEISDSTIRMYHVGDSMALVVGQRGKLKYQTISHSPIGYAVEAGILDEDEAMSHEERHIISNVVGSSDMRLEVGSILELSKRDTLLIASDGLYDNLSIDEIIGIIRCGKLEVAANSLLQECNNRMTTSNPDLVSKPDDLTFILYRQ